MGSESRTLSPGVQNAAQTLMALSPSEFETLVGAMMAQEDDTGEHHAGVVLSVMFEPDSMSTDPNLPPELQTIATMLGKLSFDQLRELVDELEAQGRNLDPSANLNAMDESRSDALPTENLFRALYPGVEIRDVPNGSPVMHGHFAKFNEWTEIDSMFEGRFMEQIAPGAFADSFARVTPKALFQHGHDPEIGDKVLGSPVSVREDDQGAYYEVPLFPSVPPLVLDGLRAGAYGASFRFSVNGEDVIRKPERSTHNPEALPERTITSASVMEMGPVTFPAYAGATAGIRSLTDEFRPHDFGTQIASMTRNRPNELAKLIERALMDAQDTVKCPNCGAMNEPDAKHCDQCGKALGAVAGGAAYTAGADDTAKCPSCGKMNEADAKYCDQCGASMAAANMAGSKPRGKPAEDKPLPPRFRTREEFIQWMSKS